MRMQREHLQLGIGDRIRVDDVPHVVIGVSGTLVRLADEAGQVQTVTMVGLLTDARFELAGAGTRRVPAVEVGLEGLPPAAAEEARWWERHIIEVLHGLPPDAPPGTRPHPAMTRKCAVWQLGRKPRRPSWQRPDGRLRRARSSTGASDMRPPRCRAG